MPLPGASNCSNFKLPAGSLTRGILLRRSIAALWMLLLCVHASGQGLDDRFKGAIGKNRAESTEWWPPKNKAPADAPNILIWLLDDAGYAQLQPYGGPIATPSISAVAETGILYSNFHSVPLCSPARAALLAGRNHHTVSMGSHALSPMGFPGYYARIPENAGSIAKILKRSGYATMALGKWDHLPAADISPAGPYDYWPSGQGFDRFYGFLAAEANHFNPVLWEDHAPVPAHGDDDYFLTTDLADHAIEYIGELQGSEPDKPFFMLWATGAVHAPHHAPEDYIQKFRGVFDEGWDALREHVLARQIALGVVPKTTVLSEKQREIADWASITEEERLLFSRQMEVFAAQLRHADDQFGRIIDYLAKIGERDNTIIIILSDNGASAEGGMTGLFNENLMFSSQRPTLAQNLPHREDWGGPRTNPHYHAGWATAGNTPFPLFKHLVHRGGTAVPMIVAWPKGGLPAGEIRTQYHHVIDVVPTLLDAIGLDPPAVLDGVEQLPLEGVSMTYSFSQPQAPTRRTQQYYEIWGNRGLWQEGWEAVTAHGGIMPWHFEKPGDLPFEQDRWELYNTASDFSTSKDLAALMPEKLASMQAAWEEQALRYRVYPLDADKTGRLVAELSKAGPAREQYVYVPPAGQRVPEPLSPPIKNRSHRITAELTAGSSDTSGMIVTSGGMPAGYALYLERGFPVYVYNYNGLSTYMIRSSVPVPVGPSVVRFDFEKTADNQGVGYLYLNDVLVGSGAISQTVPGVFSVQEGFDVGMDSGSSVTPDYETPFKFEGELHRVTFDLLAGEAGR
jgi:arylsulfatase